MESPYLFYCGWACKPSIVSLPRGAVSFDTNYRVLKIVKEKAHETVLPFVKLDCFVNLLYFASIFLTNRKQFV